MLMSLVGVKASAYDIEVKNDDGVTIYYRYINNDTELAVTFYNLTKKLYSGSVVIPEVVTYGGRTFSVTSIDNGAFDGCSGLTSVTIPSSVKSIGDDAFTGCKGLRKVIVKDIAAWCGISFGVNYYYSSTIWGITTANISNPLFYASLYSDEDTRITDLVIPDGVRSIKSDAFWYCSGLTSVTIPSSVNSIGDGAFENCTGLKRVIVKDIAAWCGISFGNSNSNPLGYAQHLYINEDTEVTNLVIPDGVMSINKYAFYNCIGITSVAIPNSVSSIGKSAFEGCSGLTEVIIPDDITSIGDNSFDVTSLRIKVRRGSKSLLSLWYAGYEPYEIDSENILTCPAVTKVSATQTTITVKPKNLYDEYVFYIEGIRTQGEDVTVSNLFPIKSANDNTYIGLSIAMGDQIGDFGVQISYWENMLTLPMSLIIEKCTSMATSIHVKGSYAEGDAQVSSQSIGVYKYNSNDLVAQASGNMASLTGLTPNEQYTIKYNVVVTNGKGYNKSYEQTRTIRTLPLVFTTSQPKVVSVGNVIVAAETNLDDEETNVGFEWRRTDWTDDFASNTGTAYLYNGTMEGYIRNLNTEKLWKYRPYYLSNSGTYYYGDWVGLDPSNTSYFEPTVHTYATITIEGNTALVKGYALAGTDKVTVQGFKYWKDVAGARGMGDASNVPSGAMTVEASGQVMTATLTGLDYGSTYHYVAFVTTSEGETFYGEEQVFSTDGDPTGIEGVHTDASEPVTIVARYNIRGERIATPQEGVNILLMSDGSTKKVWIRKR